MDNNFIDGMRAEKPHDNAPDFVKVKGSFKKDDLINWLQKQPGEWINWNIKESKKGNYYVEVDTWKPKQEHKEAARTAKEVSDFINAGQDQSDLPF